MELTINKLSGYGIFLLSIILSILIIRELRTAVMATSWEAPKKAGIANRIVLFIFGWLFYLGIVSLSGITSTFDTIPPRMVLLVILPALIIILFLIFSGRTDQMLKHLSPRFLIMIQFFRVFVELLIWLAFTSNLLPVQMTFEGRNLDIIAGATAPVAASFLMRNGKLNRQLILWWNIGGLVLLANIVGIAILSFPTPIRFFLNDPSSTIVTTFPWIYLPGTLVVTAYSCHALSLRQLYLMSKKG